MLAVTAVLPALTQSLPAVAATDDWPAYLHDNQRTGASSDTTVSTANAAQLSPKWTAQTGGVISASVTVSGTTAYVGSWDGYEYALDTATGAVKWKTYLGITTADPICLPSKIGVGSTAAIAAGTLYVGGGDAYWYALDPVSGAVKWKLPTGDNSAAGGHYNWSSPLILGNYAYIGIASLGDCPLVQGKLLKVDLTSHVVSATFNYVPDGEIGGGLWTSPAYDPATNTIFATTGTENSRTQTYAQAFVAHNADTLAATSSWRLPEDQAVLDSDFSTTPTLFNDANGRPLAVSINKNGKAYALDRRNLAAGPVWGAYVAEGGACPTCGESSVSSGAYGGGRLYLAGETTTINGAGYPGSVRAFDPTTGNLLWAHPTTGPVLGALTYANGVVYASSGSVFEALDAASGGRLFSYDLGSNIYSAPTIAGGKVYVSSLSGKIYAFALGAPIVPPADPNCPTGWTCQDVGSPAPAGSETVASGTWSVKAGGGGAAGASDQARLMTQIISGDVQAAAKVTQQPAVSPASEAGVMLRQSNDPASPYYAAIVKPGGLSVQYRTGFGGGTTVLTPNAPGGLPLYVEVQRRGDTLSAATSTDGANWTLAPGTSVTMAMPAAVLGGLLVSSGQNGTAGTASFTTVAAGAINNTPQPPASSACPTGWTCTDVGNPAIVGDQSLSGSTWTVKGAGGDIWNTSDQFRFVRRPLSGDGTVSAQIASQANTDSYAKAGVMLRADATAGSAYYAAYVTPAKGITVQYRTASNFNAGEAATLAGAAPAYLRIARSGNAFTAYSSPDGTNWQAVPGSTVTITMPTSLVAGMAVTSHNTGVLGSATFAAISVATGAPPPPNLCPSGWSCNDIGFPTPSGGQSLAGGTWGVDAGGADIWDQGDQFRFISQPLTTDGGVSARVASQDNTSDWAKAGVMLRDDTTAGSPYYAALVTPAHGVAVQYRATPGAASNQILLAGVAPLYLKVARVGTSFTAYTSANGSSWTAVPGSTVTLPGITGSLQAGLAATSHNPSASGHVGYDTVLIGADAPGPLPSPWADTDIGATGPAGSATYLNGAYTVKGSGWDIWQGDDQFNYAWQPLSGDGTITARITGQTNTNSWAKAGVMIKESATAGAKYAFMATTPGNGQHFQSNFTGDIAGGNAALPVWVRLVRSGNNFTAYTSADGIAWIAVGTTSIAMNSSATVGLAVTAHNGNALSAATFDNVSVVAPAGLPTGWKDADVGSPGLAGLATYGSGVFTVKGAGFDIWQTDDQFHYAYKALAGDGSIVARVTAQSNTDPWAKSGVIIKQSTTAGSNYTALMVTPGNGLHYQSNFTADQSLGAQALPAWLKLTRAGNVVTAYKSADGNTWLQVGTPVTLSLANPATIGLFVTSHNGGALNTTTFDNVTVTP